ncbi:Putative SET domain-containing protein [Septoria linicola]|uniref:SET domain-containing protein n=1 Tax=Septoria linicola TaxID=215465 RepID=A0A9Q9AVG6_9PEZI|nr:putative SET domain-containing protein [Septoria linicola]USW52596.1 Putative SET domain-containing protein [Septoria linicola]
MIETWEEGERKQALIDHIRFARAAQQQQAVKLKDTPRSAAQLLDRDAICNILSTGRDHAISTESARSTLQALIVEHPYPACKTSINHLDCTLQINDFILETRHPGKALIAHRFGPVVTSAIGGTYGIEDEAGTTELLLVDAYSFAGDDIIPPDAVIAIKEPYCKVDASGKPRIKLSHPIDLVVLDPSDELVPWQWRVDDLVISDTTQPASTSTFHTCQPPPQSQIDAVEVRKTAHAGRGLFAKQAFKFGDQILTESPIFMISPDDGNTYRALKYDLGKNMMTEDNLGAPYKELARQICQDPALAAKVFDLYSGAVQAPRSAENIVDGKPVIDIFHIHEIWAKNAIACPVHSEGEEKAFPNRLSPDSPSASGLWYQTAFCNHSCIPNAEKSIKDGVLTLRATRDVKKDEEITISYGEYTDQAEKEQALRRIWGFRCGCTLCESEARVAEDLKSRREEIRSRIAAPLPEPVANAAITEAKSLVGKIRAAYADENEGELEEPHPLPRIGLAEAYSRLYAIHSKLVNLDEAEQALLQMLKALCIMELNEDEVVPLGGILDEATVVNVLLLAELQKKARQVKIAEQLEDFAKRAYVVLNGDMGGFEGIVLPV